jgi:ribose transport system ATP-binding protein
MAKRLQVKGLWKSYNVPVLKDFDFTLEAGEVHALVGGNGAGKSTFARILCGLTHRNAGGCFLDGAPYAPRSKQEATKAGVIMVLQELNVISTLSVAENLFFDRLPHHWGVIDRRRLRDEARTALDRVGLKDLDPDLRVARLGVGTQQLVEIAAALAQDCRVLILDEPSAALTATESEELFRRIRGLQNNGVGIIYVSHRMDEIRRIADRVTVLRDGRCTGSHKARAVRNSTLFEEMAGKTEPRQAAPRPSLLPGTRVVLDVREIQAGDRVNGVSFKVRAGEVLGIAGLVGAGRTELLRVLFGADARETGVIRLNGEPVDIRSPRDAVRAGIVMIPEDRKADGLLLPQSILANVTLASHERISRRGWIKLQEEERLTEDQCERLDTKHAGLERPVAELSGGNQQKTIMGRWLLREASVLLLDEPTRGVDIAAKETLYRLFEDLAAEGRAIVMVSSELPELMAVCDRILVLSAGRPVRSFEPPDWSEEAITAAAFHGHLESGEATSGRRQQS